MIVLLTLCICCIIFFRLQERYRSLLNIEFLTKEETQQFFKNDVDGYIEQLTLPDLIAQRTTSHSEFQTNIIKASAHFTLKEKEKCIQACTLADKWFRTNMPSLPGIDNIKLATLKWKLSLTRGKANEEGLPHTRTDIIFLSDEVLTLSLKELTRTLIHEKVHVYERLFPHHIDIWMNKSGYKRYNRLTKYKLARSNPDVDGWTYINPNGIETVVLYRSDNPKGIDDVIYPGPQHPNTEHPYETLAYMIDNMY